MNSQSSQWTNWCWHAHACVDTYVPVRTQEGEGRVNSEFQKGRECFFQLINQYIKVCIKKLILKLCILRLQTSLHVLQARMFCLLFWICSLVHLPFSAQRSAITVSYKAKWTKWPFSIILCFTCNSVPVLWLNVCRCDYMHVIRYI